VVSTVADHQVDLIVKAKKGNPVISGETQCTASTIEAAQ
jgi:hypothetical protein